MLSGNTIYLRPVLVSDAPIVLSWENDPDIWGVTETPGPFSLQEIEQFIRDSSDLFTGGQMRFLICTKKEHQPIGAVDLFDFNSASRTAGVGILIGEKKYRNKGVASEALQTLVHFSKIDLKLKKLECLIYPDNQPSIRLFEKCNFKPEEVTFFKEKKAIRYIHQEA